MNNSKSIKMRPRFELSRVKENGDNQKITLFSIGGLVKELESLSLDRKRFIGLSAFAGAFAFLAGCTQPSDLIMDEVIEEVSEVEAVQEEKEKQPDPELIEATEVCEGLLAHSEPINALLFSEDSRHLLSGGDDSFIKLWNVDNGALVHKLKVDDSAVLSLAIKPNSNMIAAGSETGSIAFYRINDNRLVKDYTLKAHGDAVNGIAFSPDGNLMASPADDHAVKIWNLDDKSEMHILNGHDKRVNCVAFSPDGRTLVSVSDDNTIKTWLVNEGALLDNITGHGKGVCSVAFSPDGNYIASGSDDTTARIWNVDDGSQVHMLTGCKSSIRSIAFSPDSSLLVSGSSDSTVKLWQLEQGWLIREYLGHGNWGVRAVTYSPSGDLIASGGSDRTIQLWSTLDNEDGSVNICFFDPDATPFEQEAITYTQTDGDGITRTYVLPCGSEIPSGAVCTCNCIPGKYRAPAPAPKAAPAPEPAPAPVPEPSTFPEAVPAPTPPAEPTPPPSISQPGGVICTCDKICTCIPVYY